eukprot:6456732-Amphidinium_carterae.2
MEAVTSLQTINWVEAYKSVLHTAFHGSNHQGVVPHERTAHCQGSEVRMVEGLSCSGIEHLPIPCLNFDLLALHQPEVAPFIPEEQATSMFPKLKDGSMHFHCLLKTSLPVTCRIFWGTLRAHPSQAAHFRRLVRAPLPCQFPTELLWPGQRQ